MLRWQKIHQVDLRIGVQGLGFRVWSFVFGFRGLGFWRCVRTVDNTLLTPQLENLHSLNGMHVVAALALTSPSPLLFLCQNPSSSPLRWLACHASSLLAGFGLSGKQMETHLTIPRDSKTP